jgi:hypothetical protein
MTVLAYMFSVLFVMPLAWFFVLIGMLAPHLAFPIALAVLAVAAVLSGIGDRVATSTSVRHHALREA